MNMYSDRIQYAAIWVGSIILWIMSAIAIYFLILKITGHSPEASDIILAIVTITLTAVITGSVYIGMILGKVNHISKDMDSQKKETRVLTNNMIELKSEFRMLSNEVRNNSVDIKSISSDLRSLTDEFRHLSSDFKRHLYPNKHL